MKALQVLLKFRLAKYKPSAANENVAEFSLIPSAILLILRYPRYVHLMQTKFNHTAASLTGELLRQGCSTASEIIVKSAEDGTPEKLQNYRQAFTEMVTEDFFIRTPVPIVVDAQVPVLEIETTKMFEMPELDLRILLDLAAGKKVEPQDGNIYWTVNFERLHQEFRDT